MGRVGTLAEQENNWTTSVLRHFDNRGEGVDKSVITGLQLISQYMVIGREIN